MVFRKGHKGALYATRTNGQGLKNVKFEKAGLPAKSEMHDGMFTLPFSTLSFSVPRTVKRYPKISKIIEVYIKDSA